MALQVGVSVPPVVAAMSASGLVVCPGEGRPGRPRCEGTLPGAAATPPRSCVLWVLGSALLPNVLPSEEAL